MLNTPRRVKTDKKDGPQTAHSGGSPFPITVWSRFIRGGGDLEMHKPKAVHGWRELLTEIGIIVIGVLIALAAEQVVEWGRWREKIEVGRDAIHNEIATNGTY